MLGTLRKMKTELQQPVKYHLSLGEQLIELNPLIGQTIKLNYTGKIFCVHCQRSIKKSFNQGFCYPCFTTLAQCDMCIMKPELCHYDAGTCREPEWGDEFCFQPHYVYLANSSGIKVGITRHTQIPTRWIDQGAVQALPILKVQSRYISGLAEIAIAEHVSDKTSWQRMLKNLQEPVDLLAKRDELLSECQEQLAAITAKFGEQAIELLPEEKVIDIQFPVEQYPVKVKSFNFDKVAEVEGVLQGIKGQYLLLDTGVINIRKFTGYEVEFEA
ncbi:DUF2797 domain-containing protein [Methylococcaceae bacterium CS1]|uniref:DUF2797 domain-containing protein n=2 Tax=Bathymodiolus platifrons methanotrophic gill symbiont TaxID=113268 RepID=UPI000B413C53|nr:DUF2797 domain-containing protein [Bathymodiolus platifrons methanotrophic gill symbiont]TXK95453.1 DUF2797 domain-containing protein [Methylococcaceae bacterium CS4]TXK99830.1 DUF2797 domain-containing protein [Methylococcaceae bacterium CS5]TXL06456.1 DUF2797 domain-containing protein [Methylococcaceae bacterium CS1]TXL07216.1 DUF2797 domain-containing protein [Methylococcaceae bacterium CS3]TXL10877.1 DUF2797 domain-containing protein [Methylococcaceae bacterium CS2]